MLYHGKISTCNPVTMSDGTVIYEARVRDASKPLAIRTPGEVSVWMSADVRKELPSGDEIEDCAITVLVREMKPGKSGLISLKGQVVKGHVTPAHFAEGQGPLPTRPAQQAQPNKAA